MVGDSPIWANNYVLDHVKANYLKHGGWIAGGALVRAYESYMGIDGKAVQGGDIDLFSSDPERLVLALTGNFTLVAESQWAYTFDGDLDHRVQIVKKPFKDMEDTINGFDAVHKMIAWNGEEMVFHPKAFGAIQQRHIVFNDGNFVTPVTSLTAIAKYAQRGYTLSPLEAIHFMTKWGVPVNDEQFTKMRGY